MKFVHLRKVPVATPRILVLSDLHGNYEALREALIYANLNDCYVILVGDILDSYDYIDRTVETVELLYQQCKQRKLISCMGNHDFKYVRTLHGGYPVMNTLQLDTLKILRNESTGDTLLRKYLSIMDIRENQSYVVVCDIGNVRIAHASTPNKILGDDLSSSRISPYIYGETSKEHDLNGYPIRTYDWVSKATHPINIVGHDRVALGKSKTDILTYTNAMGNVIIFTDCSSGKQEDGLLGGVELHLTDDDYSYEVVGVMKFG